jgi:hypothetical protein
VSKGKKEMKEDSSVSQLGNALDRTRGISEIGVILTGLV